MDRMGTSGRPGTGHPIPADPGKAELNDKHADGSGDTAAQPERIIGAISHRGDVRQLLSSRGGSPST